MSKISHCFALALKVALTTKQSDLIFIGPFQGQPIDIIFGTKKAAPKGAAFYFRMGVA